MRSSYLVLISRIKKTNPVCKMLILGSGSQNMEDLASDVAGPLASCGKTAQVLGRSIDQSSKLESVFIIEEMILDLTD